MYEDELPAARQMHSLSPTARREALDCAREVQRLSSHLLQELADPRGIATSDTRPSSAPVSEQYIRAIIGARQARSGFFPDGLFSDPAWDMLLELYATDLGQGRVSVTRLCEGSGTSPSTALRLLNRMRKHQLIDRERDTADGRRVFVSLSPGGRQAMDDFFAQISDLQMPV